MALCVDIKKNFGSFKLNVCFEAGPGMLGLLGASGSGKSLTLKCIAGMEKPDEGRIVLDGRVLFDSAAKIDLPPQQRRTGYLFQQYALFPNMTVVQNVMAGVRDGSMHQKQAQAVAKLAAMRLEGLEHKRPNQLSGGEQQRVALARMLVNDPALILLDEPFSALDSFLKWQLEAELADTLAAFPGTAVLVSHERGEIYRNCKNICALDHGASAPVEDAHSFFANPKTLGAARLCGCKNCAPYTRDVSGTLCVDGWGASLTPACAAPASGHVGIRAHSLRIASGNEQNLIPCRVVRIVEDVSSTLVLLLPQADNARPLCMELGSTPKIKTGERIAVCVSPEDILLLE